MSHCHGWSAGPAHLLPTHVLGVVPTEPGFARILVKPQLSDLFWAEGIIPTPHGHITVRWERKERLTGTITLPPGIQGEAVVPDHDGFIHIPLVSGTNLIQ